MCLLYRLDHGHPEGGVGLEKVAFRDSALHQLGLHQTDAVHTAAHTTRHLVVHDGVRDGRHRLQAGAGEDKW